MAKGGFRGGMPGGMNQASMLKQAQKMQQEMLRMQQEQEAKTFTAKAGGGMVAATVNGKHELVNLEVNPEAVDPDDADAPPDPAESAAAPVSEETPMGFWPELCGAVRKELRPPVSGFFAPTPNAPVQGALIGDILELRCGNDFIAKMLDKPEILEVVSRKVSAMLGRPTRVTVVDMTAKPAGNPRMEQLMQFGREHSDIIKIKNN